MLCDSLYDFNILPDDIIYEIFQILPIYNLPLCNKKLYEMIINYKPFIIFKNHLSNISCGEYHTNIINNQLSLLGIKSLPIKYDLKNLLSTHSGEKHSIIWCKDKLYGLGYNNWYQLGLNSINIDMLTLININTDDILAIACGDNHTIFLKKDGLYGIGYNKYGQLGNVDMDVITKLTKIDIFIDETIEKIACGANHTILMTKSKVYGFGCNTNSQLTGVFNNFKNPLILLYNNNNIIDISCGGVSTLILTTDGVYGCGSNINSELALGWKNTIDIPTKIPIDNVIKIKNGHYFSLFLTSSGELYGCGDNYYGQLGVKNVNNIKLPVKISIYPIQDFSCGDHHLIIKSKNKYYGSGWNKHHQLGLGNYQNKKYNYFKLLKI